MAQQLLQKSCDINMGSDCGLLAQLYRDGVGIERDLDVALKLYDKACNLGNNESCRQLELLKDKDHAYNTDQATSANTAILEAQAQELLYYRDYVSKIENELEMVRGFVLERETNRDVFNLSK